MIRSGPGSKEAVGASGPGLGRLPASPVPDPVVLPESAPDPAAQVPVPTPVVLPESLLPVPACPGIRLFRCFLSRCKNVHVAFAPAQYQ